MTALGDAVRRALPVTRHPEDIVPTSAWRRTIALLCVPATSTPTTARLLWEAQTRAEPGCWPELAPGEATVLDGDLRALAAETERTDPWTAARNLHGGDAR